MARLNVNDNVIIKENGQTGVIKGRDIIDVGGGKIKVVYIVRTGNGIENWKEYTRKELTKVPQVPKDKPNKVLVVDAEGGYKVTLVAVVDKTESWEWPDDSSFNEFMFRKAGKMLRIGYAIYNPADEYNAKLGERIATHRAKNAPFTKITTDFSGEFNEKTVYAIMKVKGEYIAEHIKDFVR